MNEKMFVNDYDQATRLTNLHGLGTRKIKGKFRVKKHVCLFPRGLSIDA